MKSILKFFVEIWYAIRSKRQLGSTFSRRLKFIRFDSMIQSELNRLLGIDNEDSMH